MLSVYLRAAALGSASGLRSQLGTGAVALAGGPSARTPLRQLTSPWGRRLAATAMIGELVADKLPQAPSRLEPAGLVTRLVLGGVSGAALAQRDGGRALLAAGVGALAAFAGSHLGARWRSVASGAFGSDLPGALIEDATGVTLAFAAARRPDGGSDRD